MTKLADYKLKFNEVCDLLYMRKIVLWERMQTSTALRYGRVKVPLTFRITRNMV